MPDYIRYSRRWDDPAILRFEYERARQKLNSADLLDGVSNAVTVAAVIPPLRPLGGVATELGFVADAERHRRQLMMEALQARILELSRSRY